MGAEINWSQNAVTRRKRFLGNRETGVSRLEFGIREFGVRREPRSGCVSRANVWKLLPETPGPVREQAESGCDE